jgi:hypothetical protein
MPRTTVISRHRSRHRHIPLLRNIIITITSSCHMIRDTHSQPISSRRRSRNNPGQPRQI